MICDFCGEQLKENDKVCPKCGTEIKEKNEKSMYALQDEIESRDDFTKTKTALIFFLIVLPPIGLYLMWSKHPRMKLVFKIIITLFYVELLRIYLYLN